MKFHDILYMTYSNHTQNIFVALSYKYGTTLRIFCEHLRDTPLFRKDAIAGN